MRPNTMILKPTCASAVMLLSESFLATSLRHAMLVTALGVVAAPSWAMTEGARLGGASYQGMTDTVVLPEIVVTATRTPTPKTNVVAQMLVIDEATLQRYGGQSVLDVLKQQAGFSSRQNGGDGSVGNFYLRGFDNKQILVLVDGMRYSSVSSGGAALGLLPASQIDRIEVLYGASGSSLYGADAMGGVIQVFTKGQKAAYNNATVSVGAGSQGSYTTQVAGQYADKNTTLSLGVGHYQTKGINATTPDNSQYYPDKDGFKSDNVSLVAKHQLTPYTQIGATGLFSKSKTDYDSSSYDPKTYASKPFINTYQDQKNGAASAFINYQKDKFSSSLKYGESIDKVTAYDGSTPTGGTFDTRQRQANLQLNYKLPIGQVVGGAEWLKQNLDSRVHYASQDSSMDYAEKERTVKSGFLGYQIAQPKYDFQAQVRNDDNSQYGNQTTYNIGGAYHVTPATRIGASYATGFRAPTFNDLYYKSAFYNGNPNLKPETSNNSELFIENKQNLDNFKQVTRLTGYHNQLKDSIVGTADFATMANVDKATITGATLTSDWQQNNVLFGLNYDYQKTKNDSTDKELYYRPKNKGLVYLGYQTPKFNVRAEIQHIDKVTYPGYDSNFNAVDKTLAGYTLVNLSGNYYISPQLSINTRLNNLTNKSYQTVNGYATKGINSFVTLNYQWF